MLWGSYAQKGAIADPQRNLILKAVHPSPLSVYRGSSAAATSRAPTNTSAGRQGADRVVNNALTESPTRQLHF